MIDNVPQVVETLITHLNAISEARMLRPSGVYRKHEETDAVVPGRMASECIKSIPISALMRRTLHYKFDDAETLALVSGYIFAKTNSIPEVISSLSHEDLPNEIDLTPEEVREAVETVRKYMGGSAVHLMSEQDKLNFAQWSVGFKLYEYTAATSVDFDAFLKEQM